jgi:hypothetical protein
MPFHENYPYATKPIVYKPLPWYKRLTFWLGQHDTEICYVVLILAALYMSWAVAVAARSGALGAGW